MHHLDVSGNPFSGRSMLYFIETVSKSHLRSLAIAGVSLKSDQPQKMRECLKLIIQSKSMQHMDLTDTGIEADSVEDIVSALKFSHTLVSIHFSGTIEIKKTIHGVLGSLLQNRMGFKTNN